MPVLAHKSFCGWEDLTTKENSPESFWLVFFCFLVVVVFSITQTKKPQQCFKVIISGGGFLVFFSFFLFLSPIAHIILCIFGGIELKIYLAMLPPSDLSQSISVNNNLHEIGCYQQLTRLSLCFGLLMG